MALVLADRVRDTTTTTGTGTVTLSGTAPTGYQNFSVVGNGNTTYYTINAGSQWEVGLGTYSSTGPTLARTTVLSSSNGGSLVNFSTGTKDVFVTYPSGESVYQDGTAIAAGTSILGVTNGGTGTNTTFTAGSVVFAGASGVYTQDNANLFWDNSNDRLGIGMSSPGNKLSVNGDASFGDSIFMGTGVSTGDCKIELGSNRSAAGNAYIDFHALAGQDYNGRLIRTSGTNGSFEITNAGTGAMTFSTNNGERMRIDGSNGNVGIGTSSPSSRLTITGGNTEIRDGNYLLLRPSGNAWDMRLQATGTQLDILSGGALGSPIMSLLNGGNVGIGTSSPGSKLDVVAQDAIRATGFQPFLTLRDSSDSNKGSRIQTASAITIFYNDATGGGTYTERMRINSSGDVGIGTSSPAAKLDVVGIASARSDISTGNSPLVAVNTNTGNNTTKYTSLLFQGYDTVGTGKNTGLVQCGPSDANYVTSYMAFQTRSGDALSERARITSAGYLLVGTTAPLGGNTSNEYKTTTAGSWPLTLNANDRGLLIRQSAASSGIYAYFEYNGGTNNGQISWSGGTTSYTTTSDARIKKNIVDAPDAGALIDAIKVRSWDFKADDVHWRYGMVAQELLPVAPEAVTVPEDEEMMMGVDYAKLVPMLIKEVQSLRARVAQLEGK